MATGLSFGAQDDEDDDLFFRSKDEAMQLDVLPRSRGGIATPEELQNRPTRAMAQPSGGGSLSLDAFLGTAAPAPAPKEKPAPSGASLSLDAFLGTASEQSSAPAPAPKEPGLAIVDSAAKSLKGVKVAWDFLANKLERAVTGEGKDTDAILAKSAKEYEQMASDPRIAEMVKLGDDAPDTVTAVRDMLGFAVRNPTMIANFLAEQVPGMVIGGGLGAVAAAPLRSAAVGAATRAGASAGVSSAVGAGVTGASANTGAVALQSLGSNYVDGLRKYEGDTEAASEYAVTKTAAEVPANAIAGAFIGLNPFASKIANVAMQAGIQGTGGAVGAYQAATSVGEEASRGEMILEFLGEAVTAPIDILQSRIGKEKDENKVQKIIEESMADRDVRGQIWDELNKDEKVAEAFRKAGIESPDDPEFDSAVLALDRQRRRNELVASVTPPTAEEQAETRKQREEEVRAAFGETASTGTGVGTGAEEQVIQRDSVVVDANTRTLAPVDGIAPKPVILPEGKFTPAGTVAMAPEDIVARQGGFDVLPAFVVQSEGQQPLQIANRFVTQRQAEITMANLQTGNYLERVLSQERNRLTPEEIAEAFTDLNALREQYRLAPLENVEDVKVTFPDVTSSGTQQLQIREGKRSKQAGGGKFYFVEAREKQSPPAETVATTAPTLAQSPVAAPAPAPVASAPATTAVADVQNQQAGTAGKAKGTQKKAATGKAAAPAPAPVPDAGAPAVQAAGVKRTAEQALKEWSAVGSAMRDLKRNGFRPAKGSKKRAEYDALEARQKELDEEFRRLQAEEKANAAAPAAAPATPAEETPEQVRQRALESWEDNDDGKVPHIPFAKLPKAAQQEWITATRPDDNEKPYNSADLHDQIVKRTNANRRADNKQKKARGEDASDLRRSEPTQDIKTVDDLTNAVQSALKPGETFRAVRVPVGDLVGKVPGIPLIQRLAKAFGKPVVFFRVEEGSADFFSGAVLRGTDTIFVNVNASRAHLRIFGHELVHAIRNSDAKTYQRFVNVIAPMLDADAYEAFTRKQRGDGVTRDDKILEEAVGDIVGDRFGETEFWKMVADENPSMFESLVDFVTEFIDNFLKKYTGNKTLGSDTLVKDLTTIREELAQIVADYQNFGVGDTAVDRGVSYSRIQGQENSGTTQVATTSGSYRKAAELVQSVNPDAKRVLDYGAGLGLGSDAMRGVFGEQANVDSYEPFPERWSGSQPVTYTSNEDISGKYDAIVNLNVLNVLEPQIRDQVAKDIMDRLAPGGVAVIGTRKWSGDVASAKNFEKAGEDKAIYVLRKSGGQTVRVYQKGFDGKELADYLSRLGGDEFEVTQGTGIAATTAVVRRREAGADFSKKGINVRNDGDNRYADLIVDGVKTLESRETDSLRPYVGQTVGIVRTGEGKAKLIGSAKIGEPISVGVDEFRALESKHLVPQGSAFDIKPGQTKFLYPLTEAKRFDGERSVESRGIVARAVDFSRNRVERSTADLMEMSPEDARSSLGLNPNPKRGDGNNVRDIGVALNNRTKREFGVIDGKDTSSASAEKLGAAMADEVELHLGRDAVTGTGLGWYSVNYPNAVKRLSSVFPEFADNKSARDVFTAIVAVTSNGEKVVKNIDNAIEIYKEFRQGGSLTESQIGTRRAAALQNNLAALQALIDAYGVDGAATHLMDEMTVAEINAELRRQGKKTNSAYTADTVMPRAALYFGPKLGAFYANLMGSEGYLTMDLWWSRSVNRMRGILQPQPTPSSIKRLAELMGMPPESDEDAVVNAALPHWRSYKDKNYKNGTELEKAANTVVKAALLELEEAPLRATDRKFQYEAARIAQQKLAERGKQLSLADIQAALWYYEKRLYAMLGGKQAQDIGYEEAIIARAESDRSAGRSTRFGGERAEGPDAGAASQEADRDVRQEEADFRRQDSAEELGGIDSPAFNRWFGNSQTKLESGVPRVWYHGTAALISAFRAKQAGAIFVSPSPDFSSDYARASQMWMARNFREFVDQKDWDKVIEGARTLIRAEVKDPDVALDLIQDIKFSSPDRVSQGAVPYLARAAAEFMPSGQNIIPVYVRAEKPFDFQNPEHINSLRGSISDSILDEVAASGDWALIEKPLFQAALRNRGYDGFYVNELGVKNLAVYQPNQLKSVFNQGTWSTEDDNISFSRKSYEDQYSDLPADVKQVAITKGHYSPPSIKDRLQSLRPQMRERIVQGMFDKLRAIRSVGEDLYMKARLANGKQDGALSTLLHFGQVFDDGGALNLKKGTKGLLESMSPLGEETDRFLLWMAANRAEKLKREDREKFFSDDDIAKLKRINLGTMKDGKSRVSTYIKVQQEMNEINRSVLDLAKAKGLITDEAYRTFAADVWYVPFYRNMEDNTSAGLSAAADSAKLVGQYFSKNLKGSDRPLNDLLENVLLNWSHILSASMKNGAANETLAQAERMGAVKKLKTAQKNSVKTMVSGKEQHWEVEDPLLLDSLTLISSLSADGLITRTAAKFKTFFTQMVSLSPTFKLNVLIADSTQGLAVSDLKRNPLGNIVKGVNLYRHERAEALAGGALFAQGSGNDGDQAAAIRRLTREAGGTAEFAADLEGLKNIFLKYKDKYDAASDALENANRMSLYKQMRDKGLSHMEATFLAKDLQDYSLQGGWPAIQWLAKVVPYFNARMQGLYKLGRGAQEDPRRFTTILAATTLVSVALWAGQYDDEDWKNREEWDRDLYWWWKIPGTQTAVRIRKPFEIGAMSSIIERGLEQIVDDSVEGKVFVKRLGAILSDNLSIGVMPQILKPLDELRRNKSDFTDRPIDPFADMANPISAENRKTAGTSAAGVALGNINALFADLVSKMTGEAVNPESLKLSPMQYDHLIRGYMGWLGTVIQTTANEINAAASEGERPTKKIDDYFVIGNFVRDLPTSQSKYLTSFYDNAKSIQQVQADINSYIKLGKIEEATELAEKKGDKLALIKLYQSARKEITDINNLIKQYNEDKAMSGEEKRLNIQRLEQLRTMYAKSVEEIRVAQKRGQ